MRNKREELVKEEKREEANGEIEKGKKNEQKRGKKS